MTVKHPTNFIDITGQKFGSWSVESYAYSKDWRAFWKCRCKCGCVKILRGDRLLRLREQPYCKSCKPRNVRIEAKSLDTHLLSRILNRSKGVFTNTFIVNGDTVYAYGSDGECFIFSANDIMLVSRHTWFRKKFRGGWYICTRIKGKETCLHTLIMGTLDGTRHVDHINLDKLDNRRQNLRFCSLHENAFNRSISTNNTIGFKGLSRHKSGRWNACISFCRCRIYLGTYDKKEDAASAYDFAAEMLFDSFAWKNGNHLPNVPSATKMIRTQVIRKCQRRLSKWSWDKNPDLLNNALSRLQKEELKLCDKVA